MNLASAEYVDGKANKTFERFIVMLSNNGFSNYLPGQGDSATIDNINAIVLYKYTDQIEDGYLVIGFSKPMTCQDAQQFVFDARWSNGKCIRDEVYHSDSYGIYIVQPFPFKSAFFGVPGSGTSFTNGPAL